MTTEQKIIRAKVGTWNFDLRAIAERGYEGATSTDHDQRAQAVGLFLTDALLQI